MIRHSCLTALILASFTAPITAHSLPLFIETWTTPGSVAGFLAYPSDTLTITQSSDTLVWGMAPSLSMATIAADAGSSGGAFVGDLAGERADFYAFDFRPDPDTQVSQLGVYLDSPAATWYYALPLPVSGQWTHYFLPLDTDLGHWAWQYGSEPFEQTLASVQTVVLEWGVPGGGGSGSLDNFEVGRTPEPATLLLLGGGGVALWLKRRHAPRHARYPPAQRAHPRRTRCPSRRIAPV